MEQWVLTLDVFYQQARVLDTSEHIEHLDILLLHRYVDGCETFVVLLECEPIILFEYGLSELYLAMRR